MKETDLKQGYYYKLIDGELEAFKYWRDMRNVNVGDILFWITSTPSTPSDFQFVLEKFLGYETIEHEKGDFEVPYFESLYYCDSLHAYCFFEPENVIKLMNDVEYFKSLDWYRDSIYCKPWIEEDKKKNN
jgi:hypothetical protein